MSDHDDGTTAAFGWSGGRHGTRKSRRMCGAETRVPKRWRSVAVIIALALLGGALEVAGQEPFRPRLVVVIVVDQLRADYLLRFGEHFEEGGLRRLMEQGAWFPEARFDHAMTSTCPGHAVVLSGSHPSAHGVVSNEWWDAEAGRVEYCARDDDAPLLGIDGEGRSPRNLIGSTVGDELKLASGGTARVFTVAGKDRSAILLGGHLADAAYFFEDTLVVTSRYYAEELPAWVGRFNASGAITQYFGRVWDRILPLEAYRFLGEDEVSGEREKPGFGRSFPHRVDGGEATPGADFVEALEYSPFHNEVVLDFAMALVQEEGLGKDGVTDLLGIGLSANDRVGHAFGPNSHEVLDVTVRTDHLIAELLAFLEAEVGLEHTLVVLTADHGVAPLPEVVARENGQASARRISPAEIRGAAETAMVRRFGAAPGGSWVAAHHRPSLYLDPAALAAAEISPEMGATVIAEALRAVDGIARVWTRTGILELRDAGSMDGTVLSFHPGRSGDVLYITEPWVIEQSDPDGTTHGSPWGYDQQVPLLWFGGGIRPGVHPEATSLVDVAPTLSALLGIARPTGAQGRVLFSPER